MDRQIKKLLNTEVQVEAYSSSDGRGKISYMPPRVLLCYPATVQQVHSSDLGNVIVSRTVLYFEATFDSLSITNKDRITLPDGTQPPIKSRNVYVDGVTGKDDLLELGI